MNGRAPLKASIDRLSKQKAIKTISNTKAA